MSDELMMTGSSISSPSYIVERSSVDSILLLFQSGVALSVSYSNEFFNFIINLPPSLNGLTEGLLGTLNGNSSDDLIFPNGTLLQITSTDATKHIFGQSCELKINLSTSVLTAFAALRAGN